MAPQPGDQITGDILSDGHGGAFVIWVDAQAGVNEHNVYLQRIDGTGRIDWQIYRTTGRPVCTAPGRQFLVRLAPDGADGVIATWYDERGASPDIYALHVMGDGTIVPSWPVDGVPVCTASGTQTDPVIAHDGAGGAFIAWEDFRKGFSNGRIYAQRMLDIGVPANGWPANGLQIAGGTGIEFQPAILPDSEGGAFIVWDRFWAAGSNTDIIATRITSSGSVAPGWPDSGLVICGAPGRQDAPSIVPDGQGGFYTAWRDYRDETDFSDGGEADIYCQRVTALGGFPPGWGGDGIPVRVAPGDERIPKAAMDGAGGLLVSWEIALSGLPNVFVQRITAEGTVAPGWDPAGVPTGTTIAEGQGPALVGDGSGGAIVAWDDYRPATQVDVYAQHITSGGTRAEGWPSSGLPIVTSPDNQQVGGGSALVSTVVGDGSGGAILAWIDWGSPGGADVVMQRITAGGAVGPSFCRGCDGIVNLSPNPSQGRFRLKVRGPGTGSSAVIRVYDIGGRLLRAKAFAGVPALGMAEVELDLTDLAAGIYLLRYSAWEYPPVVGTRKLVFVR